MLTLSLCQAPRPSPYCWPILFASWICYPGDPLSSSLTRFLVLESTDNVQQHTLLRNREKLITKSVNQKLKHSHPSPAFAGPAFALLPHPPHPATSLSFVPGASSERVFGPACSFMSPAEETMRHYQPSSASTTSPQATGKPAGCWLPCKACYQFSEHLLSSWLSWLYLYSCSDPNHIFCMCRDNSTPGASTIFYNNLFTHKPHVHKHNPWMPHEIIPPPVFGIPPTQSFVVFNPAPTTTEPAPIPAALPWPVLPAPASTPLPVLPLSALSIISEKGPPLSPPHVKTFSTHLPAPAPILPPMPITTNNDLPHNMTCFIWPWILALSPPLMLRSAAL